jgi:predicted Zn-dependent protease
MNETIERHRRMVTQFPQNELARFSLGKALFDSGDYAAAREQFAVALERKPEWMAVQILIGRCELALGNRLAARTALEEGRRLAIRQRHQGPLEETEQLLAQLGKEP